jgi:RND family efflux transporter MFP subunit
MRRNITVVRIALILLIGCVIAAILILTSPKQKQQPHLELGPLVNVIVAQDTSTTITVEAFGTAYAKTEVTETAEVSGRITHMSLKLKEGMFFKKGDLLMEIDPRSHELAVQRIKARIQQQEADLLRIEQDKKNNEHDLKLASEELKLATKEWERYKNLKATKVASEAAVESVEIKYLQSKTRKQAIENALAVLVHQKAAAEAQSSMARVELKEAELSLSKTRIFAPFDGRTAEKLVEERQFVTLGTPLVQIYDTSSVEVTVQLPLDDVRLLDLILPLKAQKDALYSSDIPARNLALAVAHLEGEGSIFSWKGFVSRVGGVVDKQTRTVAIIAEFPEPWASEENKRKPPLIPGTFVRVEIFGKELDHVCELPRSAIRPDNTVYIADNGLLRIRQVQILQTVENKAYVSTGIKPGDLIITSPLSAVTEGMKIRTATQD